MQFTLCEYIGKIYMVQYTIYMIIRGNRGAKAAIEVITEVIRGNRGAKAAIEVIRVNQR